MFPQGLPGIALVLLRVSVALTVLLHAYDQPAGLPTWLLAVMLLLALLLVVGFQTPIVALLTLPVHLMMLIDIPASSLWLLVIPVLQALALALLGPGAYSLDARRFGRRVVELPSRDGE